MKKINHILGLAACVAAAAFAARGAEDFPRETIVLGLKDARDTKRLQAIKHALKNGEADTEMVALLAGALKDASPDVRRASASALEKLGTLAAPAVVAVPVPVSAPTAAPAQINPATQTPAVAPAVAADVPVPVKPVESHAREAVPALIEAAADKDISTRAAIVSALGTLARGDKKALPILLSALKDPSPQMRVTAIDSLRRFGADAAETQPALIAAALTETHPDAINALAASLADCNPVPPELLPFYINAMKGSNALRLKAVDAFNKLGAKALPAMLPMLKSELVLTRREAAAFVEKFAKDAKEAVPQLTAGLTDTDFYVRKSSLAALVVLGPDAMGALPELLKMLAHSDAVVRSGAASAIESLGPAAAAQALPGLRAMMSDKMLASRHAAAKALSKMGEAGRNELLAQLKSPRDDVRSAAALALPNCGDAALPGLAEVLKSDAPEAIAAALFALDKMGGPREPAITPTIPLLRYKTPAIRTQAGTVLAKSGAHAVKPLIDALNAAPDATPELRSAMTDALGRAGKDAVPPLLEIVSAKHDGPMLYAAIEALGKVGAPASETTPLLMSMLTTVPAAPTPAAVPVLPAKTKAAAIAQALAQAVPAAPQAPVVPAYIKLDMAIIQALANFGPSAEVSLPVLFEMLKDGDYTVRSEAGRAIARIAKGTERIPPLSETLERCDGGALANALRAFKDAGMKALLVELDTPSVAIRSRISNVFSNLPIPAAYAFLGASLKNEEPRVRSGVAQILADFRRISRKGGAAANAANQLNATILESLLIALKEGVKDSDPDVRVLCAYSYQKAIDADDGELIERVASGLAQCTADNRLRGMIALDFYNLEKAPRKAAPALPVLIRMSGQDYANAPSAKMLMHRIGVSKDDVPVLVEALKEKSMYVRRAALHALESLGADAKEAVVPLIEAMADEDKGAKLLEPVLLAIGQDAVPALIDALKSTNLKTRAGVIQTLSAMNLDGEWLGKIAALLSDDRPELRAGALAVLSTSVDRAKYALPHVKDLLVDGDKQSARARLEFFAVLGTEATPALLDALKDPNPLARSRAAIALKPRGTLPPPPEALKPLTALLNDDNTDVKAAALQTLSGYSENVELILPGLADVMKDESVLLRRSALLYLKQHGSVAPVPALNALAIALKDPTYKVRAMAIDALKEVGAPAGPLLFQAIGDPEHTVRAQAAAALEALGLANDPDKKILIEEMFALDAIEQYAIAQEEHFIKAFDDNRVHYYAAALSELPVLPKTLVAANALEAAPVAYNGFFFKMLEGQGASAPGGAKKYLVDGKMTQGHALAAFPAEHGKSGRFTFIVGDDGTIYKKDLGAETARLGTELRDLNPDDTWTKFKVKPKDEGPVRFHPLDPEAADDMEF